MRIVEHLARVICRRTCPKGLACICDEFCFYEAEATSSIAAILNWITAEARPLPPEGE